MCERRRRSPRASPRFVLESAPVPGDGSEFLSRDTMEPAAELIEASVRRALAEDLGEVGDITTRAALTEPRRARAVVRAKADGVIAGLDWAVATFRACDERLAVEALVADGTRVARGKRVLRVIGDAAAILAAERTALNFLQRASGVASLTREFVDAVAGTSAVILETRKTVPGLRALDKQAVELGGGRNHRFGLFDQILLKENHFAAAVPDTIEAVVRRAVEASPADRVVIAEARTVAEAEAAVRGGAGVVMLDNFAADPGLAAAIARVRAVGREVGTAVQIEVSGGISLENVRAFAALGVDRISVGALTHSAPVLDLGLDVDIESDPT